jgi:hypothetical protein
MHKIRLAWRILTGKAHVLEVSEETHKDVLSSVQKDRATVEDVLATAIYLYEENTEPYREAMDRETALGNQVREAMKGIDL